ncbi:MAG TPA: DUF1588 domain-containing protein, partial [Pirellulales bacterium]
MGRSRFSFRITPERFASGRSWLRLAALVGFAAWGLSDSAMLAVEPTPNAAKTLDAATSDSSRDSAPALAILRAHCYDCHSGDAKEGGFALDALVAAGDSPDAKRQWRKVWKMVRQEFMPPVGSEMPSRDDRTALVRWIEQATLHVDYAAPDPGRVTMRRLNRMEYEATVNDLFGVDVTSAENVSSMGAGGEARLRDMLPPDDTAFGFDNIGDFQTLSPALLEKYFDIAEVIVGKVIVLDGDSYAVRRLSRSALDVAEDREAKRTEHVARFEVGEPGEYRVDVQFSLGGWQEFGGGFDFRFDLDDEPVEAEPIEVGGSRKHVYTRKGYLDQGRHTLRLVTKATKPDSSGQLVNLRLHPTIRVTGPIAADRIVYPESHQRIFFEGEAPTNREAKRAYARKILDRLASRAFRRPVDASTLDRLTDLALSEPKFERGVGNAMLAILTSGRFLFRTELQPQPDDPTHRHPLDEYAIASRLSYLLWLSLPDQELTDLAAAGELRKNLPAQLKRMLADRKSSRFLEDFAGQWLRTRNVLMTAIAKRDLVDPVRGEMKHESDMLFEYIVKNDRDLLELVTANYTFLNEPLARYYGIDGVEGGEFQRVDLKPDSHRGGLLTHGSFLVSTSNPNQTSPVKRGLFVLENLLAIQPPPPPPNIPGLEDAKIEGKRPRTVREQLAAHRADASCAACHAHFDPIGVSLENYDVTGRWRDDDRGAPIDPTATTISGEQLAGVDDLKKYIASNPERFYGCVAEKLLTYALGRGLEPYDAVTVDRIAEAVAADGGKFSTLLLRVVESPAFQTR